MSDTRTDIELIGLPGLPTAAQRLLINGVGVSTERIEVHGYADGDKCKPVGVTVRLIPDSLRFTEPEDGD